MYACHLGPEIHLKILSVAANHMMMKQFLQNWISIHVSHCFLSQGCTFVLKKKSQHLNESMIYALQSHFVGLQGGSGSGLSFLWQIRNTNWVCIYLSKHTALVTVTEKCFWGGTLLLIFMTSRLYRKRFMHLHPLQSTLILNSKSYAAGKWERDYQHDTACTLRCQHQAPCSSVAGRAPAKTTALIPQPSLWISALV